jgi:protocatechuate 3,4-dioxygenase beta subunit
MFSVFLIAVSSAFAQTATLRGQVFDQTGSVVPQASIILTDSRGKATTALSSNEGSYTFSGLAPGKYKVQASAPNMAQEPQQMRRHSCLAAKTSIPWPMIPKT